MTSKEKIIKMLDNFTESQLQRVFEYLEKISKETTKITDVIFSDGEKLLSKDLLKAMNDANHDE